jgi:hypothetical protein
MSGGRIKACEVILLGDDNRSIARGLVAVDVDEGLPQIICWEGDTFLRVAGLAFFFRKTRVMHAGASFEALA